MFTRMRGKVILRGSFPRSYQGTGDVHDQLRSRYALAGTLYCHQSEMS
jgi:hypothetical protein